MARYRGSSIQTRPQASSADLIHLASDFIYDRKKVNLLSNLNQNTIQLKEAVIISSAIKSQENEKLIEQQSNTNQLLANINHLSSQKLKLSQVSNEIQKASFNQLLSISQHLKDMKILEIDDRKHRVTLHEISLEIERIHQIKVEFPEWSLLNLEILMEIIDENSMSIENFSTSFSDLSHAQKIFDNLNSLRNELLALNKGN